VDRWRGGEVDGVDVVAPAPSAPDTAIVRSLGLKDPVWILSGARLEPVSSRPIGLSALSLGHLRGLDEGVRGN
jgi:hypothetical protein